VDPDPVWTGTENLVSNLIPSPNLPARSESLHRLHCPGPHSSLVHMIINLFDVITVELHLPGLIGTDSHPDMQKI